jgi:hypothetical protein
MRSIILAAGLLLPGMALAGPIGSACAASERARGQTALCNCIQVAADATLTRAEQRQAARFFRDPHRAQEVRASTTDEDNRFWSRYVAFGQLAEAKCAR